MCVEALAKVTNGDAAVLGADTKSRSERLRIDVWNGVRGLREAPCGQGLSMAILETSCEIFEAPFPRLSDISTELTVNDINEVAIVAVSEEVGTDTQRDKG